VDNDTAFLVDLEFVLSTTAPARLEGRGLVEAAGQTAQEQDLAQLELLSGASNVQVPRSGVCVSEEGLMSKDSLQLVL
jgi:hypothetical protein